MKKVFLIALLASSVFVGLMVTAQRAEARTPACRLIYGTSVDCTSGLGW